MRTTTKPHTIANNAYMLARLWRVCPSRVIHTFLMSILDYGTWSFYSIVFYAYIFNAIEQKLNFSHIILFMLCVAAAFLLVNAYEAWFHRHHKPLTDQLIAYRFNSLLFDKASAVDISCYENPDFYNTYTLALQEAGTRAVTILDTLATITASLLSSSFVVLSMFFMDPIVALFTALPVIGSFYLGKRINKHTYERTKEFTPHTRKMDYVGRTVFLQKFAKEIRLTRIFTVMQQIYEVGYNGFIGTVHKYRKRVFRVTFAQSFICFPLVFESVWFYVAYKVLVEHSMSAGDFVVLSSAIVSATNMMLSLMRSLTQAAEHGLYVGNFKAFLQYKEKISELQDGRIPADRAHTLELRNVSFSYGETPVLQHLNMTLNAGERIALVGHNGSGKTTLVKLLMRLYDVTEGEILLDGINIKEYNVKAYRALFGTVFQDFQLLSMSVLENVAMGSIENDEQRQRCVDALRKSGVLDKIETLKQGADTVLTREFDEDGAVLSGGENQKIAVARMFARDSDIVVLDEPSSALDPIAEYRMYETLTSAYTGTDKLVVLISHRLSSAVLADRIYMLEQGRIIETGTHAALLSQQGAYAALFNKQAKHYVDQNLGEAEVTV